MGTPLSNDELTRSNAYWRAANYLSVGQIYLLDNALLHEPLRVEHVKPRPLGHWGTTPGLNFVYAHLNRAIRERLLESASSSAAQAMAVRVWSPTPIWKARTASVTRASARTTAECGACSDNSRSLAESRATPRPRRPGRSTRAASLATASPTPTARPSTIPICSSPVWSATARPRPAARDLLALEQIPGPSDRRRGAPDSASQRLQDRQSDHPGTYFAPGAGVPVRGLRLRAVHRRRRRTAGHASVDGGNPRHCPGSDRRHPARCPVQPAGPPSGPAGR